MTHIETFYIVSNTLGWVMFIGVAWMAGSRPGLRYVWLSAAILGVLLCLGRWPGVFYPHELNVDESQVIAQAMKYRIAPIPWLHVDGGSGGPLNSYWLVLPALVGVPFGYPAARIMGLACVWLFLLFATLTARARLGLRTALILCAPFVAFFAFVRNPEFMHYSSEHMPIALLSAAAYFCDRIIRAPARAGTNRDRVIAGMLAGAVPFTKLQAAPIAMGILMLAVLYDGARVRWSNAMAIVWRSIGATLMPYVAGVIAVVILILGPVAAAGSLRDFWISYGSFGASYGSGVDNRWSILFGLLESTPVFTSFAAAMLALSVSFIVLGIRPRSFAADGLTSVAIALVSSACTVLAVLVAGRPYPHYLLLFVVPLWCLVLAAAVVSGVQHEQRIPGTLAAVACLAVVTFTLLSRQDAIRGWFDTARFRMRQAPFDVPAPALMALARPGDSMTIWGWEPRIYVETGLPPGTRDTVTFGALAGGRYHDYYLCRVVSDLRNGRPRFFLDAVRKGAFTFDDRATSGHEQFAPLEMFIQSEYSYAGEIGEPGQGYRLYLLNDREVSTLSTADDRPGPRTC